MSVSVIQQAKIQAQVLVPPQRRKQILSFALVYDPDGRCTNPSALETRTQFRM